jgi:enolase
VKGGKIKAGDFVVIRYSVDPQEFMIAPVGAPSFRENLRRGAETYQALKAALRQTQATAIPL